MTPSDMTKEEKKEAAKKAKRRRQMKWALIVAVVVVIVTDGYFNRWDTVLSLVHRNTLALQTEDGDDWKLTSGEGMTVLRISDAARLARLDSLRAFDRPYNTAGFYRLYFRRSDTLSSTVTTLYRKLTQFDKGHKIDKTIFTGGQALRSVLRFFGRDTTKDTTAYVPPPPEAAPAGDNSPPGLLDDSIRIGDLWSGKVSDVTDAGTKLVGKSPTAVIGIGLGIIAAAGLDMLKGDVYVAYAPTDVFKLRQVMVGPRAGTWEGKEIDIMWLFAPGELERPPRDTTRSAP